MCLKDQILALLLFAMHINDLPTALDVGIVKFFFINLIWMMWHIGYVVTSNSKSMRSHQNRHLMLLL